MLENFTRKFFLFYFLSEIIVCLNRSSSYEDELIWSAAWLYKATGNAEYLTKAENMYQSRSQTWTSWAFDWSDKLPGAQLLLYQMTGKDIYKNDVQAFCDYAMGIKKTPGGQTHLSQWGSNRYASNFAFICLGVIIQSDFMFFNVYKNVNFRLPMLESKLLNTQPMLTNKLDTCLETVEEVMWLGLVTTIPSSLITRQPPVPAPQLSAHGTPLETPPKTILIS